MYGIYKVNVHTYLEKQKNNIQNDTEFQLLLFIFPTIIAIQDGFGILLESRTYRRLHSNPRIFWNPESGFKPTGFKFGIFPRIHIRIHYYVGIRNPD